MTFNRVYIIQKTSRSNVYTIHVLCQRISRIHINFYGYKQLMATKMKVKRKTIQNMRIREDRAEKLRTKSYEISMKAKFIISESEIVNFLIDKYVDKVDYFKEELTVDD